MRKTARQKFDPREKKKKENNISLPVHEIKIERQVPIPMADGTILRANVYRPATPGRFPVLVERVAYELERRCRYTGEYYASRGYVVVGQNVRGRFDSDGIFAPFRDDGWGVHRDGYDTILWAGKQSWSNGAVGMLDGSYSGGNTIPACSNTTDLPQGALRARGFVRYLS